MALNFVPATSHVEQSNGKYELNPALAVTVSIGKSTRIGDTKTAVVSTLNLRAVKKDDLVVCSQKGGKIVKIFTDQDSVNQINKKDSELKPMIYHVPKSPFQPYQDEEDNQIVELNFFKLSGQSLELVDKAIPRLFALNLGTSLMQVKRMIHDNLRGIFTEAIEDDNELNQLIEIHVKDNLPFIPLDGGADKVKAVCEFCFEQHTEKEEYCDLKLNGVEANSDLATASNITVRDIRQNM